MKCCICGKEIVGYGNSALPLMESICCDHCNNHVIIPARLYAVAKEQGITDVGRNLVMQPNPRAKVGAKVLIVEMIGEPNYTGKCGIIEKIDDLGQLHGTWGGCALIQEQDTYFIFD